jgi:hypothetical protein
MVDGKPGFRVAGRAGGVVLISGAKAFDRKVREGFAKVAKKG